MAAHDDQERVQRRQQIIDGALAVFAEKGFDKATNQEIAAAAGISSADLIYHYFDSKVVSGFSRLYAACLCPRSASDSSSVRSICPPSAAARACNVAMRAARASANRPAAWWFDESICILLGDGKLAGCGGDRLTALARKTGIDRPQRVEGGLPAGLVAMGQHQLLAGGFLLGLNEWEARPSSRPARAAVPRRPGAARAGEARHPSPVRPTPRRSGRATAATERAVPRATKRGVGRTGLPGSAPGQPTVAIEILPGTRAESCCVRADQRQANMSSRPR